MLEAMSAINLRLNGYGIAIIAVCVVCVGYYLIGPSYHGIQTIDLKDLLSVSIEAARRGGDRVKKIRSQASLDAKSKGLTDEGAKEMVTNGDMESHLIMLNTFLKVYSTNLKVISEEKEKPAQDLSKIEKPDLHLKEIDNVKGQKIPISDITVWIDPLDATQEYTENLLKYVTTMVCVAVKGKPVMGVIHQPFKGDNGETVWSYVNHGSSSNLKVEKKEITPPYKLIVSRSHAGKVEEEAKTAFGKETVVIPAGGAGYKTLQVIQGNADAYVHVTKIKKWDICAGNAIINSVGGEMTTIEGKEVDYSASGSAVNNDGLVAALDKRKEFLDKLQPVFEKQGH